MKATKILLACLGLLAALAGVLLFTRGGRSADLRPGVAHLARREQPFDQIARDHDQGEDGRQALAREPAGGPAARLCPESVLPSFWHYVAEVRSTRAEDRENFLATPARALETMSEEQRQRLGVLSLEGLELEFEYGTKLLDVELCDSLMERWSECARLAGVEPELRDAVIRFFGQETALGLAVADPDLIGLAATFLGYFVDREEDLRVVLDTVLPVVEVALDDRALDWDRVRPLLGLVSDAGRYSWARPRLLALLDRPLLREGHHSFVFLIYLTANQPFEEWRSDIELLLRDRDAAIRWGAVEALRGFAAPGRAGTEQRLSPETVMEVLPLELLRDESPTLLLAAIELTVRYGGEPGREVLLALLEDPGAPRGAILGFLSGREGGLEPEQCLALLQSADRALRLAAVGALGDLVGRNELPYSHLRALAIDDEDPEIRRGAVGALGEIDSPEALADLELAARDLDGAVQLEAVRQIGLSATPQHDFLRGVATDVTRQDDVRERAFQEWMLDVEDVALPEVFDAMYGDPNREIQTQGYLWKAAIAQASGDEASLAAWEELPIPQQLIEAAASNAFERAAAGVLPGVVRTEIRERIQQQAERLLGSANRRDVAQFDAALSFFENETRATRMLKRPTESQKRLIRFLDAQAARNR